MRNNLKELNNCLFEELERLNDDETLGYEGEFNREMKRSHAITNIANQIIQNAKVILDAQKYADKGSEDFVNKIGDYYQVQTVKKLGENPNTGVFKDIKINEKTGKRI